LSATTIDLEATPPQQPSWRRRWIWLAGAAVAFVFFRFTSNLSLSVLVACLRFGWADLRIAVWILRNDPRKNRACLLSLFEITLGAFRVVLAGGVAAFILAVLFCLSENLGVPDLEPVYAVFLTSVAGLAAASGLALIGLFAAIAIRQKIWVDRSFVRHLERAYPPTQFAVWNEMVPLQMVLATVVFFLGGVGAFAVGVSPVVPLDTWLVVTATLLGALIPAALVAVLIDRITAQSPVECWPELRAGAVLTIEPLPSLGQDQKRVGFERAIPQGAPAASDLDR